jgi:hypothetical protein
MMETTSQPQASRTTELLRMLSNLGARLALVLEQHPEAEQEAEVDIDLIRMELGTAYMLIEGLSPAFNRTYIAYRLLQQLQRRFPLQNTE